MSNLPPRVLAKLETLKDAEQQALTIMSSNQRAISETQKALDINPHGDKAPVLKREIARIQALQIDYQDRYRALADLNAKVERFLALLSANVELDDARPIRSKTKADESHLQAVQRLRSRIMELIAERGRVERASPTTKEMKAAAKRYVESLAVRGTPQLIIEHGKFDMQFGRGTMSDFLPPEAMLAWVDPALLQHRLDEMIDGMPKSGRQIDADERKQRLDEIKAELFDLERHECSHIDAAREEGTTIQHRPNVDIKALLGLVTSRSKANAA
ncbi:hypothetical protein H8A97_15490 [Bradyrhizobium sp. Arg62]|uniref:hypothetical protein n=1 Tax=Bradyrhizobium brasilense TaxID=1419277 RepID=UPI001E3A91B5|nr:hypothetical protein [Bradyrhizobium brasilense]MCC8946479.1 hypothetical protein [Bradyrhizobium brasilense]